MTAPSVLRYCRPGRAGTRLVTRSMLTLAALWTVAACTTGFVYNRLDWIVSWYVNGMVSLDEAQDRQLHEAVQRTLDWHRRVELPRYVTMLEEMAVESAGRFTPDRLEQRYLEVSGFIDQFIRHVNPEVASLLRTLDAEQLDELEASIQEDNEELWEEYGGTTPEIRRKRRTRAAVKAVQRFTGRLSGDQRALIEQRLTAMNDVTEEWLERRRNWQRSFMTLLRTPPTGTQLDEALLDLALHPDQFDTPEYRRRVEANRRIVTSMLAELSGGLTSRQREHLARKFRDYADDLRDIGAGG